MRRLVLTLCALSMAVALPAAQSAEEEIARATMVAPPALRANAMVIKLDSGGDYTVLREGSNDLVCWDRSDEPGRAFSVQCTSFANLARIQQNRAFNMSGKTADEIRAMRDEAEENGHPRGLGLRQRLLHAERGGRRVGQPAHHHRRPVRQRRVDGLLGRGQLHPGRLLGHVR